ncbi:MAG TPA: ABC transporter substrate-binding protein [Tabrizicola sp.]|nr:ABC transporter substrate-binding protein [Tabrizicola sp.]
MKRDTMKLNSLIGQFLLASLLSSAAFAQSVEAPQRIKDAGKLVFCSELAYAPWESIDPETQKPVGFDIDISTGVAKEMGVTSEYKDIAFDGLIPALQAGQCDAVISSLYDKPERREVVNFVNYAVTGTSIILRNDSTLPVSTLDDLSGQKVAVQIGTTGEELLVEASKRLEEAGKAPIDIVILKTTTEAFQQVMAGLVVAYLATTDQAGFYNKLNPDSIKLAGEPLNTFQTGIAIRKDDEDLTKAIDAAFANMKADGSYQAILDTWNFQALALP